MGREAKKEVNVFQFTWPFLGLSSLPAGWEVDAIFTFFLFNQLCDNYLAVQGTILISVLYMLVCPNSIYIFLS